MVLVNISMHLDTSLVSDDVLRINENNLVGNHIFLAWKLL